MRLLVSFKVNLGIFLPESKVLELGPDALSMIKYLRLRWCILWQLRKDNLREFIFSMCQSYIVVYQLSRVSIVLLSSAHAVAVE